MIDDLFVSLISIAVLVGYACLGFIVSIPFFKIYVIIKHRLEIERNKKRRRFYKEGEW